MNRRLVSVFAVVLGIAGCSGKATPTSPTTTSSVISPAGSWSGSIRDSVSGDGTMQLSLSDEAVSGPGASALLGLTLVNAVVTSGRLTAVTVRASCSSISPASGTINLSKQ